MPLLDGIEFRQVFWGALKAGLVPAPVDAVLSTQVYGEILRHWEAAGGDGGA